MNRSASDRYKRALSVVAGVAGVVILLAWLMGAFHRALPPGPAIAAPGRSAVGDRLMVASMPVRRHETAIGTIRAVHETLVASRVLGRVETLAITRAGQPVQKDELLVTLEASDLRAAAEQARATLRVAISRRDQAKIDFERSQSLVATGVAAPDRLERDHTALTAAEAEVERSRQAVAAADSVLAFTSIHAPITGVVVDKQVQVGDVVQPGQPICSIYDPRLMQLVAVVREELAGRLRVGQEVEVQLDAIAKHCQGLVAEIVPSAQAESRSFEVKVSGLCQAGVVSGMFGRLFVPLEEVAELRVPRRAVYQQGQLDFVDVVEGDRALRRLVRLGRDSNGQVELLSGVAAGETVLLPAEGR